MCFEKENQMGQTYIVKSRSKRKFHWVIPNVVRTTVMYKTNDRDIVFVSLPPCTFGMVIIPQV